MRETMRRVVTAAETFSPRNWWFPRARLERPEEFDPRANEAYSATIRRTMFVLWTVGLFCLLTTFGAPDTALLEPAPSIRVPFADAPISFAGFLVAAPLLLLGATIYLHIFFGHWLELDETRRKMEPSAARIPALFSFDHLVPRLLTAFTLYWLTPLVLAAITYKAAARAAWGAPLALATWAAAANLAVLQIRRCPEKPRRMWWDLWVPRFVLAASTIVLGSLVLAGPSFWPSLRRPLDLFHADLSGKWLSDQDLRAADLRHANLSRAILRGADLTAARLYRADLTRADLSGARLLRASLDGANLTSANLFSADLTRARSIGTDFTKANLAGANLTRANLSAANLTETELRGTRLEATDLTDAWLERVDFSHAECTTASQFARARSGMMAILRDTACPEPRRRTPRADRIVE